MGNHASPPPDNATPSHVELGSRLARRALLVSALATCAALVAGLSYASVALSLRYFQPGGSVGDHAIGCAVHGCADDGWAATPIIPSFSSPAPAKDAAPKPTHTASRTPTPSPAPTLRSVPEAVPPPPAVIVTYAAVRQWGSGFEGKLTIVNHGTATIRAWEIAISLPGDRVSRVWDAAGHVEGDVLVLQPTAWDPPIPPNGELSANFVADGTTTSPTSCTYNGAACT
jgi:hypothetical protein